MPAMSATYFRAQAYNNAWANHRLLSACGRLDDAALNAARTSFFPSILHTLSHILTVDWFYVGSLEGRCPGYSVFAQEIPFPTFADLDREQRDVDRRLIRACETLDDDVLAEPIDLVRDGWTQRERRDRTLLHLFQHQIHHRGQVHAMLAGTDVAPPQLDEFFLADPGERGLRAGDFAALDFDEDIIWR